MSHSHKCPHSSFHKFFDTLRRFDKDRLRAKIERVLRDVNHRNVVPLRCFYSLYSHPKKYILITPADFAGNKRELLINIRFVSILTNLAKTKF